MKRERTITLGLGDVIEDTKQREGQKEVKHLLKVTHVGTSPRDGDYLHANFAVGESGVHSSMTLYLSEGERVGKKVRTPRRFTTGGGFLAHVIRKVKAPKGTKWSYEG